MSSEKIDFEQIQPKKNIYNPEKARILREKSQFKEFVLRLPKGLTGKWLYMSEFLVATNNRGHLQSLLERGLEKGWVKYDDETGKYLINNLD